MKITPRLPLLSAAILLVPASAFATNGYQLIGVGAYQKSLGGAVTANPGTAMTAVTNPAGSARVGNRTDFSIEAFMPDRNVDFTAMGGEKNTSAVDLYGVPAIGWTAPVSDGSKYYFGGGMYGTSGMGVDYASGLMMPATAMPSPPMYWDGYSNISFWQMAPTLAWNENDKLSFGVSLNVDYQSVAFQQRVLADTDADGAGDTLISNFNLSRGASGMGFGISFGVLYDVSDKLTIGASYKSKQDFNELEYNLAQGDITDPVAGAMPAGIYKLDLDFPHQMAVGLSARPNDQWTVSADLKMIKWSSTMDKLAVVGPNGITIPMDPGWDDQTVFALGVQYALNDRVNLRAGYNYASSPIEDADVSRNLILPAVVESHYTIGADYALNNHWELAWHYMVAPEVSYKAPATDPMAPGAEVSLKETSFGINIGYIF